MRKVVRRIGPISLGKIGAIVYGTLGLLAGIFVACVSLTGAFVGAFADAGRFGAFLGMFFGVGAIVLLPITYAIVGFIVPTIVALIYNAATGIVGGLELEIEDR